MKKSNLLCLILMLTLLFAGCTKGVDSPAVPPAPEASRAPAALPGELVSLSFSETHSWYSRVQGYEFSAEGGAYTAGIWLADDSEKPYLVPVDKAWAEKLEDILARYDTLQWDGFHGNDKMLLDGTSFGIMYTLSDGTSVTAGGYGKFPKGYGGAAAEIDEMFLRLLPEELRDW